MEVEAAAALVVATTSGKWDQRPTTTGGGGYEGFCGGWVSGVICERVGSRRHNTSIFRGRGLRRSAILSANTTKCAASTLDTFDFCRGIARPPVFFSPPRFLWRYCSTSLRIPAGTHPVTNARKHCCSFLGARTHPHGLASGDTDEEGDPQPLQPNRARGQGNERRQHHLRGEGQTHPARAARSRGAQRGPSGGAAPVCACVVEG